ncbi:ATP-binding protein [Lipingzhangella sp. LS1_29]|uniref:ATP-binding protein n=1 Tax=Lipingzhangella rawalii TaxID=2055835 RepID=A0ABU2H592_9ACTN|nr:ATP-binding protein [Lipingzhangella rawalii]MDS1270479.1 ATP-binding protein [Lipingzhangella rawalii]
MSPPLFPSPSSPVGAIQCCLPGTPASVAHARAWLAIWLTAWNVPEDTAAAATLVLSELATNAATHTHSAGPQGRYHVRLNPHPGALLLSVSDAGAPSAPRPALPSGTLPDPAAETGRGLALVAHHARRWWSRGTPTGRTITAELPTP